MTIKQSVLFTFALVLIAFVQISSSQNTTEPAFPRSLRDAMASRYERYHHNLWHNVRENWDKLSNTTKEGIRKLGWAPPRIGRKWVNNTSSPIPENGSGEDFLYMHRVMIQKANKILADNKEPYYRRIQGWKTIPAPGDKNYPADRKSVV